MSENEIKKELYDKALTRAKNFYSRFCSWTGDNGNFDQLPQATKHAYIMSAGLGKKKEAPKEPKPKKEKKAPVVKKQQTEKKDSQPSFSI